MIFLPAVCEPCSTLDLLSGDECLVNHLVCQQCAGALTIVAGAALRANDIPLFEELRGTVRQSGISAAGAQRLADVLDNGRRAETTAKAFDELDGRARSELAGLIPATHTPTSKFLAVLATILRAHALSADSSKASRSSADASPYWLWPSAAE